MWLRVTVSTTISIRVKAVWTEMRVRVRVEANTLKVTVIATVTIINYVTFDSHISQSHFTVIFDSRSVSQSVSSV